MSKAIIYCCDICEKPLKSVTPSGIETYLEQKEGFCYEIGYSKDCDGWGRRQNFGNFSGEVCQDCFKSCREATKEFINKIAELYPEQQRNRHTMHDVHENKPSPDGRIGKVLRLLS